MGKQFQWLFIPLWNMCGRGYDKSTKILTLLLRRSDISDYLHPLTQQSSLPHELKKPLNFFG